MRFSRSIILLFRAMAIWSMVIWPMAGWAGDSDMDALEILKQMYVAAQTLNYHGTFVYVHDGQIESMRIIHGVDQDGEHERLFHLNGSPREVIREKNLVTYIMPDNKSVVVNERQVSQPMFLALPGDLKNLRQLYDFSLLGEDRIAGKKATIVLVGPRDRFRYGYRVWVDKESALLLKSDLLNEHNDIIERMMFTQIEVVDTIPREMLVPTIKGEEFTWYRDTLASELDGVEEIWRVVRMPEGFRPAKHYKSRVLTYNSPVEHIVISDGLASLSVYIEKLNAGIKKYIGPSYQGALNVYGTVVGDHQVTVVGEVPQATVKMVADSVQIMDK